MYFMAKTIMISNDAYEKLKSLKEKEDKSFSEVVIELVEDKGTKKMKDLKKYFGILKVDTDYDRGLKEVRQGWKRWTEKYA